MLIIKTLDVEINKNGKSYLVSNNNITGTSLEVLSFMSSGIKKRSGSGASEGRPGRINYYSEDDYRTITMTVEATAEDMQDIAHLRDAVNELFDGEMFIREMRVKDIKVEYERPGERTGELQLEAPEYVNGKQIKVAKVNSIEIDDTTLKSVFTVEFETTELPYFESIYTTLELHDSGYSATAEKYGLVDNIDDEKVQYVFQGNDNNNRIPMESSAWESGSFYSTGTNNNNSTDIRTADYITVTKGATITVSNYSETNIRTMGVYEWDGSTYIGVTWISSGMKTFEASGNLIKIALFPTDGTSLSTSVVNNTGARIKLEYVSENTLDNDRFTVWNAGNVTVEPESMMLNIIVNAVQSTNNFTIRNITTGEEVILKRESKGSHFRIQGMVISLGSITNIFRDTNRRFISLVPGDNQFEILNGTFEEIRFEFKYLYK